MVENNPYKPMAAVMQESEKPTVGGYWRLDERLVVDESGHLPDRCVKCNQPATPPEKPRKLYWHSPWLYLLLLLNVILYAVVAAFVRKKIKVFPALCELHIRKRRIFIASAWVGMLGSIGAMILLGSSSSFAIVLLPLLGVVFAIVGVLGSRIVWPTKVDDNAFVYLKGCGSAYLESLPDFADRRYQQMRKWSGP